MSSRSIVPAASPDRAVKPALRTNAIVGKFQLIANRHNVRRLDVSMHETAIMEAEVEGIEVRRAMLGFDGGEYRPE